MTSAPGGSQVDPPPAMSVERIAERRRDVERHHVFSAHIVEELLDEIDRLRARSAVVRPTRDALAAVIANGIPGVDGFVFPVSVNDLCAADALLAQFDIRERVAVSDSQETPTL